MMRIEALMLRRLLSILLFAATMLPLCAPLLSMVAAAEMPLAACCRRDGKHHCAMSAAERAILMGEGDAAKAVWVRALCTMYPQRQSSLGAVHLSCFVPERRALQATDAVCDPSAELQAECLRRISFDRSRQKRGPPITSL
jgi:hypothetical protein